ncbi:S8 family serine peptidase [Spirosoma aureum]|uniref:S8 family serine peptidase n=1 Tax=Spirosoma aureum TaxID=2692134 RepID=A0A6G9AMA6_9BACT|nr:S8 family serine peptidase [Spirosoma aureum]QIP13540.1 S8 family serine peptidase [Spirosoma aureum]
MSYDLPKPRRFTITIPELGKAQVVVEPVSGKRPGLIIKPELRNRRTYSRLQNLDKSVVVQLRDAKDRKVRYLAVKNQKIVLLTDAQLKEFRSEKLAVEQVVRKRGREISSKPLTIRYTVSDCPALVKGENIHTVLLEWEENTGFVNGSISPELRFFNDRGRIIVDANSQSDNSFIISPDDTLDPPVPPHACASTVNTVLGESDYKTLTPEDIDHYRRWANDYTGPTVAVLDTGLKFNFRNKGGVEPLDGPYYYRDAKTGEPRHFVVAFQEEPDSTCRNLPGNHIGYCAVCRYKQSDFLLQATANQISAGLPCQTKDICNSPFDDHRILDNTGKLLDGRHGTSIAAIIQQKAEVRILPVKAFDNQGFGTLFDMLNAFNYILHRQQADNIRVVNASWITGRDEPLLLQKVQQLMSADVFLVAAAGNIGQSIDPNLNNVPLYPACYSTVCPNVITVTTAARTYRTQTVGSRTKAPTSNDPLEQGLNEERQRRTILKQFGIDDPAIRFRFEGLIAVENFSTTFVNIGVVGDVQGYFKSPVLGGGLLNGSSFACGYVSAAVAEELRTHSASTRAQLIAALTSRDTMLKSEGVNDGRYLLP